MANAAMPAEPLRAPFPWFGGKSTVASLVWERLGADVTNYVEPFAGSAAMLLARPQIGNVETINDADGFVANFWRSVAADPDGVAHHADWPVSETDLEARHYWLVTEGRARLAAVLGDPTRYDAQVAGWWLWGICSWIGGGWCSGVGPWQWDGSEWANRKLPHLSNAGQGINRQLPHLGDAGQGINRRRPHLSDAGQGINRRRPHLSNAGQGINKGQGDAIREWMHALSARLRRVRVCSGDWARVCGPSVTTKHGLTGVFLDPPYADTAGRTENIYATDCLNVAHDVRRWAIERGNDPLFRICLAGYESEHEMPGTWETVAWKAQGGYGNRGDGRGRENASRERLWFSPHCLRPDVKEPFLFSFLEAAE
jgi:hypothetical protein